MGFNEEEGEDLVASFSGGWKMRIGLGKVLLKDPNVLLLGALNVPAIIFDVTSFVTYLFSFSFLVTRRTDKPS
jgi:ABC-type taurine transport system ATPase subunit